MADFFEIDFLDVESEKSGDAICLRYSVAGLTYIHVVDGGFQSTGDSMITHMHNHYDKATFVDHVVATHHDGDHSGGLRRILEGLKVGALWMLCPWHYADELLPRFENYNSAVALRAKLRSLYPNLAALEDIAKEKGIPIYEAFQGAKIGAFTVLTPSKARYLDLIVASDRTPEATEAHTSALAALEKALASVARKAANFVRAMWGEEVFSTNETSCENEMSVVQFATLCGERILLTADTGRAGLREAADYVATMGVQLPGIQRFQVPHHGSRRNVSTELLDRWLGPRLAAKLEPGSELFTSIVSSAKADTHHPRKAVVRAIIHRGGRVVATEGQSIRTYRNAPDRDGWSPLSGMPYPEEQEQE